MSEPIDFTKVNEKSTEFEFLANGRSECLEGMDISDPESADYRMYQQKLIAIDSIAPNLEASYELLGLNEHPMFSRETWESGYNDLYYWEWVRWMVSYTKRSYQEPAIPRPVN